MSNFRVTKLRITISKITRGIDAKYHYKSLSLYEFIFLQTSLVKYIFNKEIPSVYKSSSTDNATVACFARVIDFLPVKKRWLDDYTKGTFNFQ